MNVPLRIGLIAEGEAELGPSIPYIKPQDGGTPIARDQEGALHTLIRREIQDLWPGECMFIQRHPTANELRIQKRRTGFGILNPKYLAQTVVAWKPVEVDIIVIVVDSDDLVEKRKGELEKALQVIRANHFDENNELRMNRSCGGLAIKSFDTWLMADAITMNALLNVTTETELPDDLETLPGDSKDVNCTKIILNALIEQSLDTQSAEIQGSNLSLKSRWQLAFLVDLNLIKRRCKAGYAFFAASLREMVSELTPSMSSSDQQADT